MSTQTEKTCVGTIDITPTWSSLIPVIVAAIQHGTPKGRDAAIVELKRLAKFVDDLNIPNEPPQKR